MKYFYDTEFIEHKQKKRFLGIPIGETKPTIDLISIGIVCEDGREYYAISKDFNLKEAWNRYDLKTEQVYGDMRNVFPEGKKTKVYWIRENVLKPIFVELFILDFGMNYEAIKEDNALSTIANKMTYSWLKELIKKHGKTNKQIAKELKYFIYEKEDVLYNKQELDFDSVGDVKSKIQLYGYYSAYDHVALCWLFGKMIDLPKGFPMYTIDLKQELDKLYQSKKDEYYLHKREIGKNFISKISLHPDYPKQTNEHNALADAKWNLKLYNFINKI